MGKLIAAEDPSVVRKKRIVQKQECLESSSRDIECLERMTEPTQAESSAREMINSNKYVVVDNESISSHSNGSTPGRRSMAKL